jgi:hypothetical protein
MVLTVSFELFSVIGLSCHRRRAEPSAQLDASVETSEPHDFAVRVHLIRRMTCPRPSHPAPDVRDDRDTPPRSRARDGGVYGFDLGKTRRKIFLRKRLDTTANHGIGRSPDEQKRYPGFPHPGSLCLRFASAFPPTLAMLAGGENFVIAGLDPAIHPSSPEGFF